MYLLYLDDSGSINNKSEDYFVLGGIAVPEKSIRWLSYELEKLAEEIDPINPRQIEFHAAEIFGGRGVWKNHNRSERIEIIQRVLLVLAEAYKNFAVFACAVHKNSYPNEDPVSLAFEDISSRFNKFLERDAPKYKHRGLIVLDQSSHEQSLQKLTTRFRAEGNRWGSYLRGICEVPLFVNSKASRIIQLADHIAYAVFRRYNAEDIKYFNCIEEHFDKIENTIHGLAHLQTCIPFCTCPACISRR